MENEELLESNEQSDSLQYDLNKVYLYTELPDKSSGRCDNCDKAHFENSVKKGVFLRQCRNCGMKKII
ncbi:hypothetical protein [Metabacillus fastidiosus]|uniref:DUF8096 domain-containing protein n=1 Tax=Metabacillus fastidiosus TaxID=1458 RepID=A0ABU6NT44_9BACI|nr:hypothetical protein [Metabacillus fastidiosus]MED4400320.1 hypothetical protein [Metabacillus fastidiosus]